MILMYICLCNQLKDRQIACAIADGACSVGETFMRLGCSPVCGKCVPYIRETVQADVSPAAAEA